MLRETMSALMELASVIINFFRGFVESITYFLKPIAQGQESSGKENFDYDLIYLEEGSLSKAQPRTDMIFIKTHVLTQEEVDNFQPFLKRPLPKVKRPPRTDHEYIGRSGS
jgi:hypothetical protein